jgi:hypothetical protein
MPSPFSLGAQNADKAFSRFVSGDVTFLNGALTTLQTVGTVAHGLSAAPDFVILQTDAMTGASTTTTNGITGWSATATTLTYTCDNTAAAQVVSIIAGNIS